MPTIVRGLTVFLFGLTMALSGCGTESTGTGPGNGEPGRAVNYFDLEVGFEAYFRIYDHNLLPVGTTRFAIIDQFFTADFSGYVAVDSIPRWMDTLNWVDTFWIVPSADTVYQLKQRYAYQQRQPVVRNHTQTDWSRPLYTVGSFGSSQRYTVMFHQRPEAETVILTSGDAFIDCGRTDLLAIYEQSGDTVLLGTEYFAPDVGRILSSFRPFVESAIYYRELIR